MKTYNRALIAFYSLLVIGISFLVIYIAVKPSVLDVMARGFSSQANRVLFGLVAVFFVVIGTKTLIDAFRRTIATHAVVQSTDLGTVNITVPALEHLVIKAAKQVKGIKEIKPKVRTVADGIAIFLQANVTPESNIPMVTQELQSIVKGYIEQIAGIRVLEARVLVDYITHDSKTRVD